MPSHLTFVADPAMMVFYDQLKEYGTGYHSSMDLLEFVDRDNQEARAHQKVSMWSPCGMLKPLRAFSSDTIVGVQFECCAAFFKQLNIDPSNIKDALEIFILYEMHVTRWVTTMCGKDVEQLPEQILRAQKQYGKVEEFLNSHPDSIDLPKPVQDLWVKAYRTKAPPPPSTQ